MTTISRKKINSMKTIKKLLALLTFWLSITSANAQPITCNNFSILGFGPDEFNSGNSLIHILLEGSEMDFINYPYISLITDCHGDTIATGSLNFFGQNGQTVQSYPVTGSIINSCLPITIEFVYGNTNFETDTCIISFSTLPIALTCNDFAPIDIETSQSNTLINIFMQGTGNTYISNPHISFVTDCVGDTIATGFNNSTGQIGITSQGYPITPFLINVCYPISVEFIYGNTNFETDTCLLTYNGTIGISETLQTVGEFSIFPNPTINHLNIQCGFKNIGNSFFICDQTGKILLIGKIISEITTIEMSNFSKGIYYIKIGNNIEETIKVFIK